MANWKNGLKLKFKGRDSFQSVVGLLDPPKLNQIFDMIRKQILLYKLG